MNAENALPTLVYRGHDNVVLAVAWSPDGERIASSARDDAGNVERRLVHIWEPEAGELLYTCDAGHTVTSLAWSPDGALLATSGWNETIDLWESDTGRHVHGYPTPMASIYDLAWSPTGDRLVLAGAGGEETADNFVLDARTGAVLTCHHGHTGMLTQGITWSPDGARLASAGYDDKTVQIWDTATGATLARVALGWQDGKDRDKALVVAWSPDGRWVASGVQYGPVRLHDAATGAVEQVWSETDDPDDLAWSPDGRWLAVASYGTAAQVWSVATASVQDSYADFRPNWAGKPWGGTALAWSPDGVRLALGSYDSTVHLWRPQLALPGDRTVAE